MGLPYTAHAVDISKDEQFKPEFLKISPNNRIPAIVDRDSGMSLMESGAILIYLADKCGKLLPKSGEARYRTIEWLMWQMGGPGPMFGQVHHFTKYNPGKAPYAEERYLKEAHRLYGVLDRRLADHEYVADDYSIADIAIWPWVSRYEWQTVDLNKYPNVKRWYVAIAKRPATQRATRYRRMSAKYRCHHRVTSCCTTAESEPPFRSFIEEELPAGRRRRSSGQ